MRAGPCSSVFAPSLSGTSASSTVASQSSLPLTLDLAHCRAHDSLSCHSSLHLLTGDLPRPAAPILSLCRSDQSHHCGVVLRPRFHTVWLTIPCWLCQKQSLRAPSKLSCPLIQSSAPSSNCVVPKLCHLLQHLFVFHLPHSTYWQIFDFFSVSTQPLTMPPHSLYSCC